MINPLCYVLYLSIREHFTNLDKLNLVKLSLVGKVFGLSRFSLLPQLSLKLTLALKVVKKLSFFLALLV
jgi:hypothetical protein